MLRDSARQLRKNLTDAESLLWSKLRYRQLDHYKFRRQVPIDCYVADFVCFEKRLIVELDGGQHNTPEVQAHDRKRSAYLVSQGFKVMRFWNNEIFENLDGVMETIWNSLQKIEGPPTPTLTREGGGLTQPAAEKDVGLPQSATPKRGNIRNTNSVQGTGPVTPSPLAGEGRGGGANGPHSPPMSVKKPTNSPRPAFTLVELMVAMALTMFIMVILSQAFVTSLEVFSGLKAIGDMQANLRTVTTLLQDDLQSDHFEGKRRLSDADLLTLKPRQGFFAVYQGPPGINLPLGINFLDEGDDPSSLGLRSYRASNHVLYFTVKARGNRPENIMSASLLSGSPLLPPFVPPAQTNFFNQPTDALFQMGNIYNSPWAEICYFMVQTGSTDEPNNPGSTVGTPLYALYRGQYLLVPDPTSANNNASNNITLPDPNPYLLKNNTNISCHPNGNKLVFNGPEDVINGIAPPTVNRTLTINTFPIIRLGEAAPPPGYPPSGASVVLSNVVSFTVQVFKGIPTPSVDYEFVGGNYQVPGTAATFDTGSTPLYTIQALKISIRLWDTTTKQSRQVTLVQDM